MNVRYLMVFFVISLNPIAGFAAAVANSDVLKNISNRAAQVCQMSLLNDFSSRLTKILSDRTDADSLFFNCRYSDAVHSDRCTKLFAEMFGRDPYNLVFKAGYPKMRIEATQDGDSCTFTSVISLSSDPNDHIVFKTNASCDRAEAPVQSLETASISMSGIQICDAKGQNVFQQTVEKLCSRQAQAAMSKHLDFPQEDNNLFSGIFRSDSDPGDFQRRQQLAIAATQDDLNAAGLEKYRVDGLVFNFTKVTNASERETAQVLAGTRESVSLASLAIQVAGSVTGLENSIGYFYVRPKGRNVSTVGSVRMLLGDFGYHFDVEPGMGLFYSVPLCGPMLLAP